MSLDPERIMDFWPLILAVARNRLPYAGHAVWEDIAGETVERALRNQDRCENPHGWLTVMAARIAIDYVRRKSNMPTLSLQEFDRLTLDAGSERHVSTLDVRAALARATAQDRTDLLRYYHDGTPLYEIYEGCGVTSPSAYSKRHTRALSRVRFIMEGVR